MCDCCYPRSSQIHDIKDSGIALPQNAAALSSILSELHETGLLLTINNASKEDIQVILNISKLTNEVHQLPVFQEYSFTTLEA